MLESELTGIEQRLEQMQEEATSMQQRRVEVQAGLDALRMLRNP